MHRMLMPYLPEHHDELIERWHRDFLPRFVPARFDFTGAWSVCTSRLVIMWGCMRRSRYVLTQGDFLAMTQHLPMDKT